jgi:Zn-dependent protease
VGVAISLVVRTAGPPWLRALASMLLVIDGFNLLPLAALDGGKVLQITLFARNLLLEIAFLVLAALGLVTCGASASCGRPCRRRSRSRAARRAS